MDLLNDWLPLVYVVVGYMMGRLAAPGAAPVDRLLSQVLAMVPKLPNLPNIPPKGSA